MPTSTDRPGAEPLALAHLRERVEELETEAEGLRGEAGTLRKETADFRRTTTLAGIAIVVVLALCVAGGVLLFVGRASARSSYNTQLRNLACLALHYTPPGTSFHADLRALYPNCPPYHAPSGSAGATSHAPSVSTAPRADQARTTAIPRHTGVPSRAAQKPSAAATRSLRAGAPPAVVRRPTATPPPPRTTSARPAPRPTTRAAPGPLGGVVNAVCSAAPLPIACPR